MMTKLPKQIKMESKANKTQWNTSNKQLRQILEINMKGKIMSPRYNKVLSHFYQLLL